MDKSEERTYDYSDQFGRWYCRATELGIREFCDDLRRQVDDFEASYAKEEKG